MFWASSAFLWALHRGFRWWPRGLCTGRQGDMQSFHQCRHGAGGFGSDPPDFAIVVDGRLLQPVQIAQHIRPFGLDAGFNAPGLQFLAEDQGEE